jgi:glycerol-3-phosphate dehydrogenase
VPDRTVTRELPRTPVDLLIVGAGINGSGIARDAALRGLRVAVAEQCDVAAGTTSRSTRLIHGGLRYLEHLELGLVRESLHERERLLSIAPHLVHPLSFLIPIYEQGRRGPWTIRAGMLAYDALSFGKRGEHHHMLSAEEALEREPGIAREGLKGAAVYFDGQVEYAERLALENALDAYDHGATFVLHRRVDSLLVSDGRCRGVVLEGGREVRADVVVNAAGPWADGVLSGLAPPQRRLIGGTKGSHLVVARFPGAPSEALYVEAEDARPYFIVPWNDLYLIGTTDLHYTGDLDHVVASDDEIEYLIDATNEVIPGARLSREDILYTYAGIRPLPVVDADTDEGSISRRHIIHDHAPEIDGLLSIVGGKLTTYRRLAEEAVDAAFAKLGRDAPSCGTAELPLPGGAVANWSGFREAFLAAAPLPPAVAERLLRIYGARAEDVLAYEPELLEVIDPSTGAIAAEVVHAFRAELATTLTDALARRTMVTLGPSAGVGPDEAAARVARQWLGWDGERARSEVRAYREWLADLRPRALERRHPQAA